MNQMKRYSRALLFVGALTLLPVGALGVAEQEPMKVSTAGVSFSVGYGGGYGYGYGNRRWNRGWRRGYYSPYYYGYYGSPYRGYYYGSPYYSGGGAVFYL